MKKRPQHTILFLLLTLLLGLLFVINLTAGSIDIPYTEIVRTIIAGQEQDHIHSEIILNLRLPKAITAIIVGISLSIAGLVMQTLFRNPLADPYILGISSGASLGVAIVVMATGILPTFFTGTGATIVAAIVGATLVMLLVIGISHKVANAISLLIVGIMLGTMTSSIVSILQYFSNPDAIKIFVLWHLGSLQAVTWHQLTIIAPLVGIGVAMIVFLQNRLDALLLGERYAQGLGVSIRQTRFFIILSTTILAGSITAFTGPIAFIGIAVPHIAKGIFKTATHRVLIPASMLIGANLILLCDIVAHIPTYPLPINTISALFGAPIIIWIILKKR